MPYEGKPVLFVDHLEDGYASALETVYTNGRFIRSYRGRRITTFGKAQDGLEYVFLTETGVYQGVIADEIICNRVLRYLSDYYGSYVTNCSSFANYIFTGEFVECQRSENFVVLSHGMRPFDMASRVDVGDVVWIAYADKRIVRSRRMDATMRRKFLDAQKQHRSTGLFTAAVPPASKPRSAEEIVDFCKNSGIDDYHFMVCVGHESGQPLWLFQNGWHKPGEEQHAFGMTIGMKNPYPLNAPFFTYIKKRRTDPTA